jgi:hypothetical protein
MERAMTRPQHHGQCGGARADRDKNCSQVLRANGGII